MNISTYTRGYSLIAIKDISSKDISELCRFLNVSFGDGYLFEPERITEGGILMKQWPNKGDIMYKTMRMSFGINGSKWPWISTHDPTNEYTILDKTICTHGTEISTFLKAFHGAPSWTIDELRKFEQCLSSIGLVIKGEYPSISSLSQ